MGPTEAEGDERVGLRGTLAALRGDGKGWTLLTVATGWLLILGLRFLVPALLPQIKETFAIDNATAGVAVTVIWLTYAAMQFPAGVLVDRVGERTLLSVSLALTGVSLLTLSAAPLFAVFLLACGAFGLGTGLFGPPRGTVLSRTYPDNDGAAFGVTLAAGSVGAAVVPFVAGLVVADVGWRATIGVTVPAFLLVSVATWWAVPDTRDVSTPADADGPSADGTAADGGEALELRAMLSGIRRAITEREVVVALAAVTLLLFAFQGLTAFLPTYLIERKGLSQGVASGLYAGLFLSGAVFQASAGRAADVYGDRRVLGAIAGFSVLPLVVLPLAGGLLALATIVVAIGIRMAIGPVNNAYIIAVLPADVRGSAWGLLRTLFFAVGSTGSVAVGALADAGYFDEAFWTLAAVTGVGAVLYVYLPERHEV